jgi:ribosomal protein L13
MTAATERIAVLVTASEKKRYAKIAKTEGLSVGELFRRAASSYRAKDEDKMLDAMIAQMIKTTAQAGAAMDRALVYIEASNKRIDALARKAAR